MKTLGFKIFFTLYLLIYLVLISLSIGVFYIFRPFTVIDNTKSYLLCTNNGYKYFIGPNLVFTFDGKIDPYNDKKARKVCEYGLIRDYGDLYKAPPAVNYTFHPVYTQESSWMDASLAFFLTLFLGMLVVEETIKFASFSLKKSLEARHLFGRLILDKLIHLIE